MKNLGTEFKVGLFALVASFTIGYMLFVLSPESFESTEYNTYYTIVNDAAGIIPKTHVKTNGVTVGKVKSVKLETNKTRIDMEVDASVQIPVSSKVEIRTRGLLGDVFIEIIRGKDEGEVVKDEGLLPINEDSMDIQQLMAVFGAIAKDVKEVTASLASSLGGEEGKKTVGNIVKNIEQFTEDVRAITGDNKDKVGSLLTNLDKTVIHIKDLVANNSSDVSRIISDIKLAVSDIRTFSANIKDVVSGENKNKIETIIGRFESAMADVGATANSVKLVSERIERGEGTIGRLVNSDETLVNIEGAIKDIRSVLAPATRLQIEVDYRTELRSNDTNQSYFNLVFKTRPDRFYVVGLTDLKYDETETRTEVNGDRVKTIQRRREATAINLQIAKRWGDVQARGGLFESTGGFGVDYFLWDDTIKFTIEAFSFDGSDDALRKVAHLKAYGSVLFYDHIFVLIGADDLTGKKNSLVASSGMNYFVGGGLTFNDQDLKAIFGTAALLN